MEKNGKQVAFTLRAMAISEGKGNYFLSSKLLVFFFRCCPLNQSKNKEIEIHINIGIGKLYDELRYRYYNKNQYY